MVYQVFCDFDGTAAVNDVGAQLFKQYGNLETCEAAVGDWLRGAISSVEMYEIECTTARISPADLETLATNQVLDQDFPGFVQRCRQHEVSVTILSDGFASYIRAILRRYGLQDLTIFANDISFIGEESIAPVFPFRQFSCGKCANCKGYHLRKHREVDAKTIYIGDGYSDRCGAQEADRILAKGDLEKYCESENIPYVSFQNFADVIAYFEEIRAFG